MSNIYTSVAQLIGHTPLLELTNIAKNDGLKATVLAKLEGRNPAGSAKDRVALSMILDAEEKGILKPGSVIIEPTSGNTGIGLCSVAAARGYKCIIVMPDSMSMERRLLMTAFGGELVLTPGAQGMTAAIAKAEELAKEIPGSWIAGQFENPVMADVHEQTTGPEIWADTDGQVDIFVVGVGTGGTLTGVGRYLKSQNPNVRIVAVEPAASAVLSGKPAGSHGIQGIGAGFIPSILDTTIIDEVITVTDEDAKNTARSLAAAEGILAGISSGAALYAALELAKKDENGNLVGIWGAMSDFTHTFLPWEDFKNGFYLAGAEHKKSVSYPEIGNVLFDEFLTNDIYLPAETTKFFSIVSTIVRLEDDVRFFLCGNTVSQYSPYFADFGIDRVRQMKKGTIDIYRYGDSGLEVAVEYAEFPETMKDGKKFKKKSDVYFAFKNNPHLKMITEGEWETNLYPHLPVDYHFWNVVYRFYIQFEGDNFECEVINPPEDTNNLPFVYIHRKTTEIKDEENFKKGYYCFKQDYDNRPLFSRDITHPRNNLEKKILKFFADNRVFYQDNLLGESIRRFFEWCNQQ